MPYGRKPGPDGLEVDFNRVYKELIVPAVEAAGFSVFRADQEQASGSILSDMFQELLIADLVIADLTIPNPNVWYEIGVRHALRARGTVLIFGGKAPSAFDLYTERKLRYGLSGDGPDPSTLQVDIQNLTSAIRATISNWSEHKSSPVYHHLPHLQEPDWKTLRLGEVKAFWQRHEAWQKRLDLARASGHLGDLLVLADEGPVAAFRAEAWICAGKALRRSAQFALAQTYLEKGLVIEPDRLDAQRELGICLQRLAQAGAPGHSVQRARQHYESLLEIHPRDSETWALLGRLDKDVWVASWRRADSDQATMRADAAYAEPLLKAALDNYERAFRAHPAHYYSGINALTLSHLAHHLNLAIGSQHVRDVMAGAVRFAADNEADKGQRYWAEVTQGDLEVLIGTPTDVSRAYRQAVSLPDVDWFSLNASRDQLLMLRNLGFRPEAVSAGLAVFDHKLKALARPQDGWQPRQVLLFSGHMMDTPTRPTPRFPQQGEPLARPAIEDALDQLGAGPDDLALCQAAAGGDLLFLEACRQRGVRCEVLLPFEEPVFIERSVMPSIDGPAWRDRFYDALRAPGTTVRVMPQELGPLPDGIDPFERCNLWLLYRALARGVGKVRMVTLWNGGGGDGPGGTAHMVGEVKRHTGQVIWLDTRELFKAL
ncbi:MAG: DUF4071 domain-containing protein [Burkholderiales bacterium]|nr:MAG: DUF4071 domain-containing protein [Burkholderiales bacterium]